MAFNYPTEADLADKSRRAGERFNNPFNMWFDKYANEVGGLQGRQITQYDTPSVFPSKILGASAAIRKMAESPLYSGKTMQDLIGTWVGHGESYAPIISQATGIPTSTRITPQFLQSPDGMRFLQTMARYETQWEKPYPLTPQDWETARRIAFDPQFRSQFMASQGQPGKGTQVASNAPTVPTPTPTTPSTPSPATTAAPATASSSSGTGFPGLYARGGILPSDLPGRSLAGVSPVLQELLGGAKAEFEKANPGYTIVATSGARPGGPSSSQHAGGNAIDMQIVGPNGQAIANTGNDPSGLYHQYARYVYAEQQANHPELNGKLAWGGAFGAQLGGGGPPDLMHFDLGGERGHWTMNRPSQLGGLPLQLANATTGAMTVATPDSILNAPAGRTGGTATPAPAPGSATPASAPLPFGLPRYPQTAPQRMGAKGGGMYIPIISDILGAFTGSMGRKGGFMQPGQTAQPQVNDILNAVAGRVAAPAPAAGNVPTPAVRPAAAPTPNSPPTALPRLGMQPSVFNPPPQPGQPGAQPGSTSISSPALTNLEGPGPWVDPGFVPRSPLRTGPPVTPFSSGLFVPPNLPPNPVNTTAPTTAAPAPNAPVAGNALTPAQVVASRFPATTGTTGYAQPVTPQGVSAPWPTGTTTPTANTPMARIPGILPGASAPLPSSVLNYLNPVSSANAAELPPGPSATAAVQGASAAGLPQGASFAERFAGGPGGPGTGQYSNPALAAALGISPQPSFPGGVPMPRANPIAGTQTALTIPPRGPWPPAPSTPQQQPRMTIAGIPLPRPRPGMPQNPPAQIPQPSQPAPQNFPRPNMPMPGSPGVPVPSPDIARTNATPGPLGGTQMPPDAAPGVRMLDAVEGPSVAATLAALTGPQSTAQDRARSPDRWDTTEPYVPQQPPYAPGQSSWADQVAGRGRGLAGPSALAPQMPWIDPRLKALPVMPGEATRPNWVAPAPSGPQSDVPGGASPSPRLAEPSVPNLMPWAERVARFGLGQGTLPYPTPSGGAPTGNVAPPVTYPGQPVPPTSYLSIFPQAPAAPAAPPQFMTPAAAARLQFQRGSPGAFGADTSGMDAATLEYLRQQMQQQNSSPDYGSYAGAY